VALCVGDGGEGEDDCRAELDKVQEKKSELLLCCGFDSQRKARM